MQENSVHGNWRQKQMYETALRKVQSGFEKTTIADNLFAITKLSLPPC
jgi:hypothetical protein